jgi:hypothetical protein
MPEIEGGVSRKDGNDNNRHVSIGVVPPRAAMLTTRSQARARIGQRPLLAHGCWRLKAGFQCRIETIIRHVSTGVVPP